MAQGESTSNTERASSPVCVGRALIEPGLANAAAAIASSVPGKTLGRHKAARPSAVPPSTGPRQAGRQSPCKPEGQQECRRRLGLSPPGGSATTEPDHMRR